GKTISIPTESTIASRRLRCSISVSAALTRHGPTGAVGFGHRIIAAATPGVAAGEPPRREPDTDDRTVPPYRFDSIVRATRQIPTGGREERREKKLINPDQHLQYQNGQPLKASAIHLTPPPPHPTGSFSGPGRFGA